MSNTDIRNILDYIFDSVSDWYALADEVGNWKANEILNGFDAVGYIEDMDAAFLISTTYSTIKLCITPDTVGLRSEIWNEFAERLNDVADEFVDKGYIHPNSIYFEIDPYSPDRAVVYYEK